jgi:hypothetical protein
MFNMRLPDSRIWHVMTRLQHVDIDCEHGTVRVAGHLAGQSPDRLSVGDLSCLPYSSDGAGGGHDALEGR